MIHQAVQAMTEDLGGSTSSGELVTVEKSAGRIISHAIFARWALNR
jgi:hypothetical protein